MTININEVQEIIKNLEGSGELSIKEEKYLNVAKLCVHLAAENSYLMHRIEWPKQQCPTTGDVTDVEPADFIPATDRIVAGIKADGAKAAGDYLKLEAQHMPVVERLMMQDAAEICYGTAARLREGANHD